MIGLLASWQSQACNACGCAAQSPSIGLLAQSEGHFAGLQYQARWFESRHDGAEAGKPPAKEFFQTVQAWGRYSINPRWQVYAFLPWQHNVKREDGTENVLSGIGDLSVLGTYRVFKSGMECSWQQEVQAGGGFKAPTGHYDNSVLGGGDALAPAMQAGTGAWDVLGHLRYTIQRPKYGMSVEANYTYAFANHQDYKYGNRVNANAQAFARLKKWNLNFLPMAGLRYEQAASDYDNYTARSVAEYTGGYMLFATAGIQVGKGRLRGIVNGYYPVSQNYGDGLVSSLGRFEGGVVCAF